MRARRAATEQLTGSGGVLVVLITGPPGAGKSTTATAVHDALGADGIDNALIEVDELERSYPPLSPARAMANLAALASAYRDGGTRLLFVTATCETDDDRAAVLDATAADAWLVVRLDAAAHVVRQRIIDREPATWHGLAELVASAERLATQIPEQVTRVDLVLDTADHDVVGTAVRVESLVRNAR